MVKINGKEIPYIPEQTVEEMLRENGFVPGKIAVERNGEILPKAFYSTEKVQQDDVFEVVNFVGGG